MIQTGILAWLLPGAGHFALGHRGLGMVFFTAITFVFFTGVAVGGVKSSVDPKANKWLFLAELGVGSYTTGFYYWSRAIDVPQDRIAEYVSFLPESEVAQIYLAAAGLLNVLAVLDALSRAQTGGLPTYHRHLTPADDGTAGGRS